MEAGFSAQSKEFNAWGYCQEACQDYIDLLSDAKDPKIGLRLFRDTLKFAQKQRVVFPPQFINIFERLKEEYQEETYTETVKKFYQDHQTEGLFEVFGDLNVAVAGHNRAYENPCFDTEIPKRNGVYLFCGPSPRKRY